MGTYVIGDVHGCFDEFMELCNRIIEQDEDAEFILVGDIIDRGSQTIEMLEWAMDNVNKPDSRFQMVLGNHEYDKIKPLVIYMGNKPLGENSDFSNYCGVDQYRFIDQLKARNYNDEQVFNIVKFIKALPVYIEKDIVLKTSEGKTKKQHYIIVHSDFPNECINKNETFKKRVLSQSHIDFCKRIKGTSPIEDVVWCRNVFGHSNLKKTIVVHGHTPTISRDLAVRGACRGRIHYLSHDINVDCGLVYKDDYNTANLGAIRLEDLQEFYLYEYDSEPLSLDKKEKLLGVQKRKKIPEDDADFWAF